MSSFVATTTPTCTRLRCGHCTATSPTVPLDELRVAGWRVWAGKTVGGEEREDAVCPSCAGTGPKKAPHPVLRLPYRPPQDERHHYLFIDTCGCPRGLVEASATIRGGPPRIEDEDQAWDEMYTPAEKRAAREAGVRVVHVDHATYERDWFDLMRGPCPHKKGAEQGAE